MIKKKAVFKLILLLLIIIIVPLILYITCRDTLFNSDWLISLPKRLSNNPGISVAILILLQALQVIICILPGQPIQFAASYMFGVFAGYIISLTGAIIGAIIAFYLAKVLGSDAIKVIFNQDKVEYYHRKINSGRGWLIVFIIYLIPGLPKDLVGYVAGISEMKLFPFLILSSIGRSPGMIGSLLVGHYFGNKNYIAIIVIAVICLIILFICWKNKNKIIDYMDKLESLEEKNNVKEDR